MNKSTLHVLLLSSLAAVLLSGCGMGNCGMGNHGCHTAQGGDKDAPSAGGGTGGGTGGGATLYTFETLPNASSADDHDASVDMTVYDARAIAVPVAHDGRAGSPPYYPAVTLALNPGQKVYVRIADPGQWGGFYSVRVGNSGRQGGASAGTAGHPDRYDTADGAKPSGGADDTYLGATTLLLDTPQDHGFWPPGEQDWLVFTAP